MKESNESTALLKPTRSRIGYSRGFVWSFVISGAATMLTSLASIEIIGKLMKQAFVLGFDQGKIDGLNGVMTDEIYTAIQVLSKGYDEVMTASDLLAMTGATNFAGLTATCASLYMAGRTGEKKWLVLALAALITTGGLLITEGLLKHPETNSANLLGYLEGYCDNPNEETFCSTLDAITSLTNLTSEQILSSTHSNGKIAGFITGGSVSAIVGFVGSFFGGRLQSKQSILNEGPSPQSDVSINNQP